MAVSVKALMLFPSRWFRPVLWGLASKGEKIVQVSQPYSVFSLLTEASNKLTSYCQKYDSNNHYAVNLKLISNNIEYQL